VNFYWFGRHLDKDLKYVSDILEDAGFYAWLIPYSAGLADPFIRIARSMSTEQKLKYLVAVRPYTISAQYLIAISKSLDLIQEDRVRINFVPGIVPESEKSIGGIFSEINDSSSYEDRKRHFCDYIRKFSELDIKKPYVYVSGFSDELCPDLEDFGDANILSYGHLHAGRLDPSDLDKIIFFPVRSIEDFREKIAEIKSKGYKNVMFHTNGDRDFDLALKVFEEVKMMNSQNTVL
jgi:hypothetical protein